MLKNGELTWQGDKDQAMDADKLSHLFDVPITVAEYQGRKFSMF